MKSIFEKYLNKDVNVVVDRPLGSKHPKFDKEATDFQERYFKSKILRV